jgi:hypothetical protein
MVEDEEEDEEEADEDNENNDLVTIDADAALKSSEYKSFITAVAELEKI